MPFAFYIFTLGFSTSPSVHELKSQHWSAARPFLPYLVPVLVLFGAVALWGLRDVWRRTEKAKLLVIWAAVPYLLFLGAGVTAIRKPVARAVVLALLLLVSAHSVWRYFTEQRYWRPDGRSVGALLQREARPADVLISCGVPEPREYYAPEHLTVRPRPELRCYASQAAMAEWVREVTAGRERLWYVKIDWLSQP